MGDYLIKDTTLTDIADAVRAKTGITDQILVSELATKIQNITTGNAESGDITTTASGELLPNMDPTSRSHSCDIECSFEPKMLFMRIGMATQDAAIQVNDNVLTETGDIIALFYCGDSNNSYVIRKDDNIVSVCKNYVEVSFQENKVTIFMDYCYFSAIYRYTWIAIK